MKNDPLRASDLRAHNQNIVLSIIYASQSRGISQSEVVHKTGLKAPTIFRIFSSLEEDGFIIPIFNEIKEDEVVKKGRRPVSYVANKDALYTIGVEFWSSCLSVAVFNFLGEKIYASAKQLHKDIMADEITDLIVGCVELLIMKLNIPKSKILGLGVAAPGQVDLNKQIILYYAPIKNMKNYPIVQLLHERLAVDIVLHNNCSALALGEYRYGGIDHNGSMFTFLIRSGVNGAFVYDDKIYVNSKNQTIETGHIPISLDGPHCSCGGKGCLQSFIQKLDYGTIKSGNVLFESFDIMLEKEDPHAIKAIEQAAAYLVIAIRTIMRLFSPQSFLLIACSTVVADALAREVKKLLEPDAFESITPQIFATAYDPFIAPKGASDLVINKFFQ
jgi:predicted NBD/HSP70 family sugar kinase